MPTYLFKLYERRDPNRTAGKLRDTLKIEADDDLGARREARLTLPPPFKYESDFAILFDPDDNIVWYLDAPEAYEESDA